MCLPLPYKSGTCIYPLGFLPEMAIVEMIQNVTNHCDINSIVKRYNTLKVVLPKEWTEIIHKNIHRRNVSRSINI